MNKKVVFVIAPENFRDEEYFYPLKILKSKGIEVTTASKGTSLAKGKLGHTAKVDIDISQIREKDFDAIVVIGGPGSLIYENNQLINQLLREFNARGKLIASICIAPRILAQSGVLNGKKATAWNEDGMQSKLIESKGGTYLERNLVEDANIITANGPQAAKEFGEQIVKYLNK